MPTTGFIDRPRIIIRPATFDVPQRVEASAKATEMGMGLLMELHSSSTHFYADATVPVGKVAIYAPKAYKGMPEYVTTLDSPEQEWYPEGHREFWEKFSQASTFSPIQTAIFNVLNEHFDLAQEPFLQMWPEFSAVLIKHGMVSVST